MGVVRMQPYVDADGNPAPERDHRPVPASLMAFYLGVHVTTFWRRVVAGTVPRSTYKVFGTVKYFYPRKVLGIEK